MDRKTDIKPQIMRMLLNLRRVIKVAKPHSRSASIISDLEADIRTAYVALDGDGEVAILVEAETLAAVAARLGTTPRVVMKKISRHNKAAGASTIVPLWIDERGPVFAPGLFAHQKPHGNLGKRHAGRKRRKGRRRG